MGQPSWESCRCGTWRTCLRVTYRTCHNQAKFPSIYVEYPVAQGLQTLIGRLFARRFPLFVSKSKSSVRAEEVDSAVSAALR